MDNPSDVSLPRVCQDFERGVLLHDPETGAILDVNERIEELYGYTEDELQSMDVGDFTASSTKFSQQEAHRRIRAASDGDPDAFEWLVERANGERRWIRVHLNSTSIAGQECVVAEIDDITEYQERENRLRLLSRIIRHNLRNRTTVLMSHADRIKRAVEDKDLEAASETILEVSREVGALTQSVRELEDIAKSDATERSPTNLCRLATKAIAQANAEYPEAQITFEVAEDVWIVADQGVTYAIDHAIENAIQHNDRERPTVEVTVEEDTDNEYGVIRIADDGPSIPDEEIDVLSDTIETSSTYHGSGVGLWVMQWCINSLGGELIFDENTPRGNIVTIRLPETDGHSVT